MLPLFSSKRIISLYFGGGTPSQVDPSHIEDFFDFMDSLKLNYAPDVEISFEANPEDLNKEYLERLKNLPINRLSIGVQSLHDESLKILDRQHDSKKAMASIENAFQSGFKNISIDLMYDLPGQTLTSWKQTLSLVKLLPITHLSLYNLTIEPQTVFFKKRKELTPLIPPDHLSLQLLETARETFEQLGLSRYEISAFAKEGYYSKHNTGYWLGREFLGFGPAAFSFLNGKRFKNISSLPGYIQKTDQKISTVDFEETLSPEASLRERLAIRLRLLEGACLTDFPCLDNDLLEEFDKLCSEGFVTMTPSTLTLTKKGTLFYDTVASCII